ncbi:MAG: hypothetical protein GEU86_00215 [Actinophytocola sp.]|nr:hypothetical protein [Actinophytocola sp.]
MGEHGAGGRTQGRGERLGPFPTAEDRDPMRRAWLDRHGVDTRSVHVSETKHTARFLCTSDTAQAKRRKTGFTGLPPIHGVGSAAASALR